MHSAFRWLTHTPGFVVQGHMSCTDLHHGGNGMDSVEVLHETLGQVGHTQPDGPVSVAFQADHLIGAAGNTVVELLYGYVHF